MPSRCVSARLLPAESRHTAATATALASYNTTATNQNDWLYSANTPKN
jgi:hypothetical protein